MLTAKSRRAQRLHQRRRRSQRKPLVGLGQELRAPVSAHSSVRAEELAGHAALAPGSCRRGGTRSGSAARWGRWARPQTHAQSATAPRQAPSAGGSRAISPRRSLGRMQHAKGHAALRGRTRSPRAARAALVLTLPSPERVGAAFSCAECAQKCSAVSSAEQGESSGWIRCRCCAKWPCCPLAARRGARMSLKPAPRTSSTPPHWQSTRTRSRTLLFTRCKRYAALLRATQA